MFPAVTSSLPAVALRLLGPFLSCRRRGTLWVWGLTCLVLLLTASPAPAELSKGYRILLDRGFQLQGLVQWDDYFHLDTYSNANYTSPNWGWTCKPSLMGNPPGVPWSRWVSGPTNMPPQSPQGDEGPYLSQCFALQLGDEWNLQDATIRGNLIDWFKAVRTNWPNTILFHNNYGGQASDAALADFIPNALPDMLSFDVYPFVAVWDVNAPNHIGPPIGGPFTGWYSELRRYRWWATQYQIPYGLYLQTFHSVQDYDQHVYRNPSPSELRLNASVALAFNAKLLTDFTYNSGATTLFDILPNGYSGDLYTNSMYLEKADVNRRAKNLGQALVCLQPVYDLHNTNDVNPPPGPGSDYYYFADGTTTSILFLKGNPGTANATPLPTGFVDDPPLPKSASWWEAGKNDPYFRGWAITNKAGINNGGLPGEVVIAWFRPLDESLDGPAFTNEVYLMVVNALTATNGTAADCMQEIKLNFAFPAGMTTVDMLDAEGGVVRTQALALVGSRRQLVLDLNGGDAALFKFSDGAPFVGYVTPAPARLSVRKAANVAEVSVEGTVGAHYQLQSTSSFPAASWSNLTNLLLPVSPWLFLDTSATNNFLFYRAVGGQ